MNLNPEPSWSSAEGSKEVLRWVFFNHQRLRVHVPNNKTFGLGFRVLGYLVLGSGVSVTVVQAFGKYMIIWYLDPKGRCAKLRPKDLVWHCVESCAV